MALMSFFKRYHHFLLKMCYYIPIFTETTTQLSTTEVSTTSGNLRARDVFPEVEIKCKPSIQR